MCSYQSMTLTMDDKRPLGPWVRDLADRGQLMPVAVVLSLFDDLLLQVSEGAPDRMLSLDEIALDAAGRASFMGPANLAALGRLLEPALTGDPAMMDPPAAACSILARLQSDDPMDRPVDAEQLRGWLRDALGSPAPRDEVCRLFWVDGFPAEEAHFEAPAPTGVDFHADFESQVESRLEAPLPVPPAARESDDLATLPPTGSQDLMRPDLTFIDSPDQPRPGDAAGLIEHLAGPPIPEAVSDAEYGDPASDSRQVVRHASTMNEPRVAIRTAPAARRSAKPQGYSQQRWDAEDGSWLPWVLAAVLAGIAAYVLLVW